MIDTLALLEERQTRSVLELPGGVRIIDAHPAANPDLGAVDPEGRWIVVASQELEESVRFGFTLRWINIEGDTAAEHHVQTTPISAEAVRAEWIDRLATGEGLPPGMIEGSSRGTIEAAANDVPFPSQQAPALSLFADSEGRAWIKSPLASADSMKRYLVSQDRGLLGSVVLPKSVELMAANAKRVWGWARGAYDEPQILKFRMDNERNLGSW